ncbi:MAG: hypothetical protein ACLSHC_02410 [Bilophila wadsworthia]
MAVSGIGQRHLPCGLPGVDAPESRAASALNAPATSPLPCMKCAMSCMAFQLGAADPRRRGYLLPPFGGIAAAAWWRRIQRLEARNWVACASNRAGRR